MLLLDELRQKLGEGERSRAVLLQYVMENVERKRVCFLEKTGSAKEEVVKAMTAPWLERHNSDTGGGGFRRTGA